MPFWMRIEFQNALQLIVVAFHICIWHKFFLNIVYCIVLQYCSCFCFLLAFLQHNQCITFSVDTFSFTSIEYINKFTSYDTTVYVFNWCWWMDVMLNKTTCVKLSALLWSECPKTWLTIRNNAWELPAVCHIYNPSFGYSHSRSVVLRAQQLIPQEKGWFMLAWPEGVNAFSH